MNVETNTERPGRFSSESRGWIALSRPSRCPVWGSLVFLGFRPVARGLTRHQCIAAADRRRAPLPEGVQRWLQASAQP